MGYDMKFRSILAILACLTIFGCTEEQPIISQNGNTAATCGNGKKNAGEECDDNNKKSGDG
ncbi:MAG: hypothetical protein IKY83_05460, partial [Proteobacteria bacterium]|nr:hypothetical protein [Pseudomonadota bacterium]